MTTDTLGHAPDMPTFLPTRTEATYPGLLRHEALGTA